MQAGLCVCILCRYETLHIRLVTAYDIFSFPFLSFPFLSFPFLSFPFLSFPFLSFPFLSFPFLSFPFLSFPFPNSFLQSRVCKEYSCIPPYEEDVVKERKGKERKGKERKGKERKGKERKGQEYAAYNSRPVPVQATWCFMVPGRMWSHTFRVWAFMCLRERQFPISFKKSHPRKTRRWVITGTCSGADKKCKLCVCWQL